MIQPAALPPIVQQAPTYLDPKETTLRKNILEKVAIFGILLGTGLLLAPFFTAFSPIPLIAGAALTALSAYAFYYLSNIDSSGALNTAAVVGNRCMVQFLLFLGANPNANPDCNTLIGLAVSGQSDIIKDLLNAGANPNSMDVCYRTPLHFAITNNHDDTVEILLIHGADPKIRTRGLEPNCNAMEWGFDRQRLALYNEENSFSYRNTPEIQDRKKRTSAERAAAANRIVEMLRPYMQEQAPNE